MEASVGCSSAKVLTEHIVLIVSGCGFELAPRPGIFIVLDLHVSAPVAPQGLEGSTPWRTCYKVARSKQGITASSSLTRSNTAIAELSKGSNTLPTDSTNLQVTMQHKSGTALIRRDIHKMDVPLIAIPSGWELTGAPDSGRRLVGWCCC